MDATPKNDKLDAMRQERDRFVALAFCAADMLLETDGDQKIAFAAGATKALTGRVPRELIGTRLRDLLAPSDRIFLDELMRTLRPGARLDPVNAHLAGPDGTTPPLSLAGYRLPDMPGRHFFALRLTAGTISPELARTLTQDPTTGLYDRDSFAKVAARRVKAAEGGAEPLKVTLLRMDKMDELRQRLDEEANQSLAATIGAALRASSEGGDSAGQLDDNSYGIVHKANVDVEGVRHQVETFAREADPTGVGISISLGTMNANSFGMTEADALRALQYSLEQFCAEGATPVAGTLTEGLENLARDTANRMAGLRKIIAEDRFAIAFQPVVDIKTRKVNHYEALVRFDAEGKSGSPYEMIVFAEATGLICDFDLAMCKKLLTWMSSPAAAAQRDLHVAANLSGRSLANVSFVNSLHELLNAFPAERSRLLFEITESARIADLDLANRFIQGLRKAGHQVCLDDFGAGAAAFQYLRALEVDVVKIDGQYLRGAIDNDKTRAFLKAMAGLCRDLEVEMIAEMVEDQRYLPLLDECGIRYGQGYLFGKPQTDIAAFKRPDRPEPVRARRMDTRRSVIRR
jgi:EAL domain-containing protein (putative c-di-GMP-specific phosphodiesterase class I)/GGDEF domain-containing protein